MNILVTGACGQLGTELRIVARGSSDRYVFTDICDLPQESLSRLEVLAPGADTSTVRLDMTDEAAVRSVMDREDIGLVVNCAAFTNVDAAEDDEPLAELLNATAPGILARAAAARGGAMVHFSTDYVFGGERYNTPCGEDLPSSPTGAYGRTKLHGEQAVAASGCTYLIIRTAWLYSEFGRNFLRTMLRLTCERPSLKVVFDQVGTPTYALDLARAVYGIVSSRAYLQHPGIYNYSGEGVCSWYDFAVHIAQAAGHSGCSVAPCHSSEFPSKVDRPAYSVLDKTKIKNTFGVEVPYWTDSLGECINNLIQSTHAN